MFLIPLKCLSTSLGADHDGEGTSEACDAGDEYIMAPTFADLHPDQEYNPNPWMFSKCSIDAFKTYIQQLGV